MLTSAGFSIRLSYSLPGIGHHSHLSRVSVFTLGQYLQDMMSSFFQDLFTLPPFNPSNCPPFFRVFPSTNRVSTVPNGHADHSCFSWGPIITFSLKLSSADIGAALCFSPDIGAEFRKLDAYIWSWLLPAIGLGRRRANLNTSREMGKRLCQV